MVRTGRLFWSLFLFTCLTGAGWPAHDSSAASTTKRKSFRHTRKHVLSSPERGPASSSSITVDEEASSSPPRNCNEAFGSHDGRDRQKVRLLTACNYAFRSVPSEGLDLPIEASLRFAEEAVQHKNLSRYLAQHRQAFLYALHEMGLAVDDARSFAARNAARPSLESFEARHRIAFQYAYKDLNFPSVEEAAQFADRVAEMPNWKTYLKKHRTLIQHAVEQQGMDLEQAMKFADRQGSIEGRLAREIAAVRYATEKMKLPPEAAKGFSDQAIRRDDFDTYLKRHKQAFQYAFTSSGMNLKSTRRAKAFADQVASRPDLEEYLNEHRVVFEYGRENLLLPPGQAMEFTDALLARPDAMTYLERHQEAFFFGFDPVAQGGMDLPSAASALEYANQMAGLKNFDTVIACHRERFRAGLAANENDPVPARQFAEKQCPIRQIR